MTGAILFVAALATPPDTAACLVYQRLDSSPQYVMACATAPAPDSIMARAPTIVFRRDGWPDRSPYDAIGQAGETLTICARVDGPRWQVCSVWDGPTLLGTFLVAPALGAGQRQGDRVTEDAERRP